MVAYRIFGSTDVNYLEGEAAVEESERHWQLNRRNRLLTLPVFPNDIRS